MSYRGNSGKYPAWYEDALVVTPLADIGLASRLCCG